MSRSNLSLLTILLLIAYRLESVTAFVLPSSKFARVQSSQLLASSPSNKQKKSVLSSPGKGFAKQPQQPLEDKYSVTDQEKKNNEGLLVSLNRENPITEQNPRTSTDVNLNRSSFTDKPVEERTKEILRKKYGLTTMEEKLGMREEIDRQDARERQNNRWKKQLERKEVEQDSWISSIPPSVLAGLSTFLKIGTGVCVALFVLAGIGITWEAWIVSTHPENVSVPPPLENFITQVVEPNFTLGLFVLLAFSISLGLITTAQLSSSSSVYQEKE